MKSELQAKFEISLEFFFSKIQKVLLLEFLNSEMVQRNSLKTSAFFTETFVKKPDHKIIRELSHQILNIPWFATHIISTKVKFEYFPKIDWFVFI